MISFELNLKKASRLDNFRCKTKVSKFGPCWEAPLLVIGHVLTVDVIGLVKGIGGQNTKTPAPFADTPFSFPFLAFLRLPHFCPCFLRLPRRLNFFGCSNLLIVNLRLHTLLVYTWCHGGYGAWQEQKYFSPPETWFYFHVTPSRKIFIAGFQCHAIQNRSNKKANPFDRLSPESGKWKEVYIQRSSPRFRS